MDAVAPKNSVTIQLDFPGMNALGTEVMDWLGAQVEAANGAPILLTGTGRAFSAGLNLREVASLDVPGMTRFLETLDTLQARIFHHPAPVVALINGHAIAGGCILALTADLRIMVDNPKAKMGLNEVALGLRLPPKCLAIARHALGTAGQTRVMLGGGLHGPASAKELGLVDMVVPEDGAEAIARKELAKLSAHPAAAYAGGKADLRAGVTDVSPERQREFNEVLVPSWCTDELKATVKALLG
jgi:enoyl-CoA hydratase